VRDTKPGESDVEHKTGDRLNVNEASRDRWLRRGAAELATEKAEPKTNGKPEPEIKKPVPARKKYWKKPE